MPRAELDADDIGGQTPLFHAVSQFYDYGLEVTRFLVASGANLAIRAKLPGHYERPDEYVEGTARDYAQMFPGGETKTMALLHSVGAP